ncbi:hypothetical protein D3C84_1226390 [compost metagenome]
MIQIASRNGIVVRLRIVVDASRRSGIIRFFRCAFGTDGAAVDHQSDIGILICRDNDRGVNAVHIVQLIG